MRPDFTLPGSQPRAPACAPVRRLWHTAAGRAPLPRAAPAIALWAAPPQRRSPPRSCPAGHACATAARARSEAIGPPPRRSAGRCQRLGQDRAKAQSIAKDLSAQGVAIFAMLVPAQRARLIHDPAASQDRPAECPCLLARAGGTASAERRVEPAGGDEPARRNAMLLPTPMRRSQMDTAVAPLPARTAGRIGAPSPSRTRRTARSVLRFGLELKRQHHAACNRHLRLGNGVSNALQPARVDDDVVVGERPRARRPSH